MGSIATNGSGFLKILGDTDTTARQSELVRCNVQRRRNRRPEGRRLKVGASGDDAALLARQLRVGRDCPRRREVEIALERKPERAASGSELVQADVA
jgi:hypothetical protein